jgi:DNA-binding MarR family transcriptional regulator
LKRKNRSAAERGDAARELLQVTMRLMRSVAKEIRHSPDQLAPGQMAALFRISYEPRTLSDLARHLGVSLPTVSKSIDVLVGREWVERWVDAHDRRQTMLRLTPQGRRVTVDMRRQSERHVAALLAPLTAPQCRRLLAAIAPLKKTLPEMPVPENLQ